MTTLLLSLPSELKLVILGYILTDLKILFRPLYRTQKAYYDPIQRLEALLLVSKSFITHGELSTAVFSSGNIAVRGLDRKHLVLAYTRSQTQLIRRFDLRVIRSPQNRDSPSPGYPGPDNLLPPEVLRADLPSLKHLTINYDPAVKLNDVLIRPFDLALTLENMRHVGCKTTPPATGANDELMSCIWMVRDQIEQAIVQLVCQPTGIKDTKPFFEWLAGVEARTGIKPDIQFMLRFKRWPDSGYLVFDLRIVSTHHPA